MAEVGFMTAMASWKSEQAQVWGDAPWQNVAESVLSPVHDQLVGRLAPHRGERWLDLATGTGAVALRAARADARVTAPDLAPTLVETARRRDEAGGFNRHVDTGRSSSAPAVQQSERGAPA